MRIAASLALAGPTTASCRCAAQSAAFSRLARHRPQKHPIGWAARM